jgi:hypothetical protein
LSIHVYNGDKSYAKKGAFMKKGFLLLMAAGILLLAACTPLTVQSGGVVLRGAAPVSTVAPEDLAYYTDEQIVYITRSGKKYHEAGCSHLSQSSIPVTLEQAQREGKEPCSRCHREP